MTRAEKKLFKKYPVPGAPSLKAKDAFRGDRIYARWARNRNAIVKIGDILYVHAGVDRWALETEPGRINSTVRAWDPATGRGSDPSLLSQPDGPWACPR